MCLTLLPHKCSLLAFFHIFADLFENLLGVCIFWKKPPFVDFPPKRIDVGTMWLPRKSRSCSEWYHLDASLVTISNNIDNVFFNAVVISTVIYGTVKEKWDTQSWYLLWRHVTQNNNSFFFFLLPLSCLIPPSTYSLFRWLETSMAVIQTAACYLEGHQDGTITPRRSSRWYD